MRNYICNLNGYKLRLIKSFQFNVTVSKDSYDKLLTYSKNEIPVQPKFGDSFNSKTGVLLLNIFLSSHRNVNLK